MTLAPYFTVSVDVLKARLFMVTLFSAAEPLVDVLRGFWKVYRTI